MTLKGSAIGYNRAWNRISGSRTRGVDEKTPSSPPITTTTSPLAQTSITNPELRLAFQYIQNTHQSVFLTGKAGTGKTTFLQQLKKRTPKRMIVTAPTGVAAINAGGVTLHSFFQLPFGPLLPNGEARQQASQHRFSREKTNIIKSLDLLVIDEISMVRADLLDGIDQVLRRYKTPNLAFGGVQLLMIGDLHQLAPVVKSEEWELLKPHYDACYFFSSQALKQIDLLTIELKHIYRQADPHFVALLNHKTAWDRVAVFPLLRPSRTLVRGKTATRS